MAIKLIKATANTFPVVHCSYTVNQWTERNGNWEQEKAITPVVTAFWEISPRELAVTTRGKCLYIVKLLDE